ncbi:MAG: DoxX family protein [Alphaproteobacteria bacterium]|nr:DoxX family protein [Alphaproteobacteria bacterium]
MNARSVSYWLTTGLIGLLYLASGAAYLSGAEPIVEGVVGHMGYPSHVLPLLGVLKVLGAIALLAPGFARLKEWAYAGIFFNLLGAVWAHLAVGDGVDGAIIPIVLIPVLFVSYALRPVSRRVSADAMVPALA